MAMSVSIRVLPAVWVACIQYWANTGQMDMYNEIHECFQRVQAWVRERGYDPLTRLTIGAIQMVNGQLASYDCCIQIPADEQMGSGEVEIKGLPGGQYAVVSIEKSPRIIGESISRFYQEYVPQNNLGIDNMRPTYEIYYESTMEYCVPIL